MKCFVIVAAIFIWSFQANNQSDIKEKVKTILQKKYGNGGLFFSAYQINPQISFISEEVLREKYIKGFYYRKSDMVNRNKNLVERVEDSIERLNTKLRETCSKEISFLNLPESRIKSERTKYVVFYSPLCNNGIYVEVVPAKSVLFYENKYGYIGEVNQYYFVFNDKHEIKKCYTGILNRD